MSDFLEFRHLKYIVAVAEAGNFTRAAERLFLAQPSLSKQIKDLEEELGFPIFVRNRDGVRLTPAGQMLIDYAQDILGSRSQILKLAKDVYAGHVGPLRVGFSPFVNSRHLRTLRTSYSALFPECAIQLAGDHTVHVLRRLEHDELDCAILSLPISGSNWVIQPLDKTPLVVVMRTDDPLAQQTLIDIESLASRLTIFRDPESHPAAHARLIQMFAETGQSIRISCSAATPHDMQSLVRDGYGIALIGEDFLLEHGLTARRLAGVEWTSDISFVHSQEASHVALPFIVRVLKKRSSTAKATSSRPQLPLQFDISA